MTKKEVIGDLHDNHITGMGWGWGSPPQPPSLSYECTIMEFLDLGVEYHFLFANRTFDPTGQPLRDLDPRVEFTGTGVLLDRESSNT